MKRLIATLAVGLVLNASPALASSATEAALAADPVAEKRLLAAQPGDVPATCADTSALERWIGFAPDTSLAEGLGRFVDWYRRYYQI